jgi:hypothetical protein
MTPLVLSTQSSRTRGEYLYSTNLSIDRIQSALRRFEPSSRSSLCGEQPHPWYHLQHQEEKSRHRGAEARVRYGLQPTTSLLSLKLLWFLERMTESSGSLWPTMKRSWSRVGEWTTPSSMFNPLRSSTFMCHTFVGLRYYLVDFHPRQTTSESI